MGHRKQGVFARGAVSRLPEAAAGGYALCDREVDLASA